MSANTQQKMDYAVRHTEAERRWQERYARRNGFFWLPCPLCGHFFSGAEWRDIDGKVASIPDEKNPSIGHGICPSCTQAGLGVERDFEDNEVEEDPDLYRKHQIENELDI